MLICFKHSHFVAAVCETLGLCSACKKKGKRKKRVPVNLNLFGEALGANMKAERKGNEREKRKNREKEEEED